MPKGFKQYDGLVGITYIKPKDTPVTKSDVVSPEQRVLDLIFSKDVAGWPNTSIEVMLSPKTSEEVRNFIQQNLLSVRDSTHLINDPSIINEFQKLESGFIAQCSRNRYESIEDYEARLNQIIKDEKLASTLKSFHDKLNELNK